MRFGVHLFCCQPCGAVRFENDRRGAPKGRTQAKAKVTKKTWRIGILQTKQESLNQRSGRSWSTAEALGPSLQRAYRSLFSLLAFRLVPLSLCDAKTSFLG